MIVMRDFSEQGNAGVVFAWPGGAITVSYALSNSTPEPGEAQLLHRLTTQQSLECFRQRSLVRRATT